MDLDADGAGAMEVLPTLGGDGARLPDEDEEDPGTEEMDDQVEAQDEWDKSGVFGDGSSMPEGDPWPGQEADALSGIEDPLLAQAEHFERVGITDFLTTGLGMAPNWEGTR